MMHNSIAQQIRVLLIIDGMSRTSLYPAPLDAIHSAAYFVDVFARTWEARTLNRAVLKRNVVPRVPSVQVALDRLVGRAVLTPASVSYRSAGGGTTSLSATYSMNRDLARPVIDLLYADEFWANERTLVGEISLAISGFAGDRMSRTVSVDATYSDPLLDNNALVDLEAEPGHWSKTEDASRQIAQIGRSEFGRDLGVAELTALYMRHIYPYTDPST